MLDSGHTNLQWQLVDVGGGYYRIVNRTNGMVADSWGNGRYQIINRGTGTALDGAGDRTVGDAVVLWAPNNSTNNQWTITAV